MQIANIKDLVINLKDKKSQIKTNLKNLDYILDNNLEDWRQYVKLNKSKYNRNVVYRDDLFEIIIITWLPGQHTKIHDHPSNGCLLKVLYGELCEIRKKCKIREYHLQTNDISYMHSSLGKHIISNVHKKPAISIHVYSPPNYYE